MIPSLKENATEKIFPITIIQQDAINIVNHLTWHDYFQWLQTTATTALYQSAKLSTDIQQEL